MRNCEKCFNIYVCLHFVGSKNITYKREILSRNRLFSCRPLHGTLYIPQNTLKVSMMCNQACRAHYIIFVGATLLPWLCSSSCGVVYLGYRASGFHITQYKYVAANRFWDGLCLGRDIGFVIAR